ncbi:cell wall integrity and stress response component 3-like [Portunus trituberculatus]|uniref:cell wall integrity and stress response component 3-like n=1 Tax=Portunus trituberculatus TaxID=210409 RepID=UPI001E1CBAC9|nr:cell wall integrity and stress response component 3-like [Portunus trituberculatus]
MCEVEGCCCLTLRQGCVLIGGITIMVSLVQTLIFSWVLVETYHSSQSATVASSSADNNSESSSFSYSFPSLSCPPGFFLLKTTSSSSSSSSSSLPSSSSTSTSPSSESPLVEVLETTTESNDTDAAGSPLTLQLRPQSDEDHDPPQSSSPPSPPSASVTSATKVTEALGSDATPLLASSSSPDGNDSVWSSTAPPIDDHNATKPSPSEVAGTRTPPRINCGAPAPSPAPHPPPPPPAGQGVLWSLVVASALYSLVGGLLVVAVLNYVSWQLSIWFFYTVGYDLFMLIVALTDGVYTSFSDISSYVVCLITTYCVIVVDSYYEKLLHDERVDKASGGGRRRSSLVIVRSSPDSPTSQHDYIPPTSYTLNTHNTLAPPPVSLAPPQPSTAVRYHALAGSPSKEPPSHKHHRHRHHAYENNI